MKKSIQKCIFGTILIIIVSLGCNRENKKNYQLIPVKVKNYWGFIDQEGNFAIKPQFDYIDYLYDDGLFTDGLTAFRNNKGNSGYINEKGEIVINPIYERVQPFREGMAVVVKKEEYPKVIDKKGIVLFEVPGVNTCGNFYEGLAIIQKGDKFGFINKLGQIQISPQFKRVYDFSNDIAPAQAIDEDFKWGLIDKTGKWIVKPQFDRLTPFSKDGLAVAMEGKVFGFIDITGRYKINPQFEIAYGFNEGLAACKKGDFFGYIDKSGFFKINPQFLDAGTFSCGFAKVQLEDKKWGLIDKSGKFVVQPKYSWISNVYGKVAIFKEDTLYGLVDINGNILVKPSFTDVKGDDIMFSPLIFSDYFDYPGVLNNIFANSTNHEYFGVTRNMSVQDIYTLFLSNKVGVRTENNGIIVEQTELISENALLLGYAYAFKENITQTNLPNNKIDHILKMYRFTFVNNEKIDMLVHKILETLKQKYPNMASQNIESREVYTHYYRFYNGELTFFITVENKLLSQVLKIEVYFL